MGASTCVVARVSFGYRRTACLDFCGVLKRLKISKHTQESLEYFNAHRNTMAFESFRWVVKDVSESPRKARLSPIIGLRLAALHRSAEKSGILYVGKLNEC